MVEQAGNVVNAKPTLIGKLRMLGFRVFVNHKRISKNRWVSVNSITKVLTPMVMPKGGKTVVEIHSPDGKAFIGEAVCSKSDSYNKKRGLAIALGRAVKQLSASVSELNLE